ncbi:hypothetical protein FRC06_006897, partial [Ceratobasidium sp. 370]
MRENLESVRRSLGPASIIETIASTAGIWPRLTPRIILRRLALHGRETTPSRWLDGLKKYARSYLEYQRSQRLIGLALSHKQEEFHKELDILKADSGGCTDDPDWLLVQIDGNFSARSLQAQIAQEMIAPSSSANTVLQLNMGEGKSSVIVPIVAASLADRSQLVRVVVLKPLWRQMFQLLVNRLGGLVDRRICYLLFGRHIRVNNTQANQIRDMYAECMRDGAILLAQPEHILSFKLMGIDQLMAECASEEAAVANDLRNTHKWLLGHSRDILDESDEILHVRYQLIYTVGRQQSLEGHPDRWTITQQLLPLVANHIAQLNKKYPSELSYEARPSGQFPFIRLMPDSDEAIAELIQLAAKDAVAGRLPSLNLRLLPPDMRETVLRFLADRNISENDAAFLERLKNDELVKYWLGLRPDINAGVYFDDKDELVILPQNGSPTPFFASPLAQHMDKCLVYLDDGHTRGTDLKLPRGTRAAVTLGPKVTKDRLLQGCMRMRKLGHGQSVMFCAPTEIDTQIRKVARRTSQDQIHTSDILLWAMLETCNDLEHHISHWAQQGIQYNRRADGQKDFAQTGDTERLKDSWMTAESRSLQEMYGISGSTTTHSGSVHPAAFSIPSLRQRLESLGVRRLEDPGMDEEQEREVSYEVEQGREVERPPKSEPATHMVHEDVLHFVNTGSVPVDPTGIVSLFHPLHSSGRVQPGIWTSKLQASVDFCRTLKAVTNITLCEYLRPVNWILSGLGGTLVVLSPYEVNQLLPDIQNSALVRLHVYAPRVTQSMISFSDLRFYSMPDSSISPPDMLVQLQLGLFSGQVYFDSHSQYRAG